MIGLDTTVLVAHELGGLKNHRKVREQVGAIVRAGKTGFALSPQVIEEFLHVVCDPRRFERPLDFDEALRRARWWWEAAEVTRCHSNDHSMDLSMQWMSEYRLGRKRILDTTLAATYHVYGVRKLATANSDDFACFGVFTFESWAFS